LAVQFERWLVLLLRDMAWLEAAYVLPPPPAPAAAIEGTDAALGKELLWLLLLLLCPPKLLLSAAKLLLRLIFLPAALPSESLPAGSIVDLRPASSMLPGFSRNSKTQMCCVKALQK
jgi:hypothetical protein